MAEDIRSSAPLSPLGFLGQQLLLRLCPGAITAKDLNDLGSLIVDATE